MRGEKAKGTKVRSSFITLGDEALDGKRILDIHLKVLFSGLTVFSSLKAELALECSYLGTRSP